MDILPAEAQRLLRDDAFKEVVSRVRQQQIDVFVNSSRFDAETLRDAKYMLEAISKIEQALQAVITEEAIKEKRKKLK